MIQRASLQRRRRQTAGEPPAVTAMDRVLSLRGYHQRRPASSTSAELPSAASASNTRNDAACSLLFTVFLTSPGRRNRDPWRPQAYSAGQLLGLVVVSHAGPPNPVDPGRGGWARPGDAGHHGSDGSDPTPYVTTRRKYRGAARTGRRRYQDSAVEKLTKPMAAPGAPLVATGH